MARLSPFVMQFTARSSVKGEYAGASNLQDDVAVMQSNGVPLRADDHGNSAGTATPLTGTSAAGVSSARAYGDRGFSQWIFVCGGDEYGNEGFDQPVKPRAGQPAPE